jgi:hypothetical protein
MSQLNPVHTFTLYFFQIYFNTLQSSESFRPTNHWAAQEEGKLMFLKASQHAEIQVAGRTETHICMHNFSPVLLQ